MIGPIILTVLLLTSADDGGCTFNHGSSPSAPAQSFTITWTSKTPLPRSLAGSACAVINDTVYVIGGRDSAGNRYNLCYMYVPARDTWITRASMPTPRAHLACGVVRGKIYVMGGWIGGTASDACEEYNPATNTWAVKAPMPTPRYTLGAATHNNLIYVIGGMNMSSQVFGNNEVYNPDSNTWTTKSSMPTPRMGGGTFLIGNTIYVAGGSNLGSALTVHEAYVIGTDQWQPRAYLGVRRYCIGACSYQGKGYAIGGYDYFNYLTTVEIFDPSVNSWSFETSMLNARQSTAVEMIQNRIYVVGGWNNGAIRHNEEGAIGVAAEEQGLARLPRTRLVARPNPARGSFTLEMVGGSGLQDACRIFDAAGKIVAERSLVAERAVKVSLPAGVYFVSLGSGPVSQQLKVVVVE